MTATTRTIGLIAAIILWGVKPTRSQDKSDVFGSDSSRRDAFIRTLNASNAYFKGSPVFDVKAYGAKGDTRTVHDGVTATGSPTVTSATAAFTQADMGKRLYACNGIVAPGQAVAIGTIIKVDSATSVTLDTKATWVNTGATLDIGTDDTAALTAAWNAAIGYAGKDSPAATKDSSPGATIYVPGGKYIITGVLPRIEGGRWVRVIGEGRHASILLMAPGQFAFPANGAFILSWTVNSYGHLEGLGIQGRGVLITLTGKTFVGCAGGIFAGTSPLSMKDVFVEGIRSTQGVCAGYGFSAASNTYIIDACFSANDYGECGDSAYGIIYLGGIATNNQYGEALYGNCRDMTFIRRVWDEGGNNGVGWQSAGNNLGMLFINCLLFAGASATPMALTEGDDFRFMSTKLMPFNHAPNRNGLRLAGNAKAWFSQSTIEGSGTGYGIVGDKGNTAQISLEDTDVINGRNLNGVTVIERKLNNFVTDMGVRRIKANQGTALAASDFVLSAGWGNAAAVSAVTGTDQGFDFTVTANGKGIGANPTLTITFKDGTWANAPILVIMQRGGTGHKPAGGIDYAPSATAPVMTWRDQPAAGQTYIFSVIGIGR